MEIYIKHKSQTTAQLNKRLGDDYLVFDLTSKGPEPWVKFSPYYPHGNIPVPFSPGVTAQSVEGIWQGLKVFENAGIDREKFEITTMKGLKRSVRKFGRVLGHLKGTGGSGLLSYREARYRIYLPAYKWILEHKLTRELELLKQTGEGKKVVFFDYEVNPSVEDLKRPLSHASLVKAFLEGDYPSI